MTTTQGVLAPTPELDPEPFHRTVMLSLEKVERRKSTPKGFPDYNVLNRHEVHGPTNEQLHALLGEYAPNFQADIEAMDSAEIRLARSLVKLDPVPYASIPFSAADAMVEFERCHLMLKGFAQLFPNWKPSSSEAANAVVLLRYDASPLIQAAAARNPSFQIKV